MVAHIWRSYCTTVCNHAVSKHNKFINKYYFMKSKQNDQLFILQQPQKFPKVPMLDSMFGHKKTKKRIASK